MSVDNKSNEDEPPLRPKHSAPFSSLVGGRTFMINTGEDVGLTGSRRKQKMLDKGQAGLR